MVIGTGGTGGYVATQLARIVYSLKNKKSIDLVYIDGDFVEPKNLLRQHFIQQDLNKNKAQVLADRYSKAFQIPIRYCDEYISSVDQLKNIFKDLGVGLPIVVGCVDNNKARKVMHQFFEDTSDIIYIDAGNEEFDGQVVMGIKKYGSVEMPPIGTVYPDIFESEVERPVSSTFNK